MISLNNNKGKLKIQPIRAKITGEISYLISIKLFCRAKLGKFSQDGHTDSAGGSTPNWPHALLSFYCNGEDSTLIQVLQKGIIEDSVVGEAKIALALIYQNKFVTSGFNLFKDQKKVGEITIQFTFEPEQIDTFQNVIYASSNHTVYYGNPFHNQSGGNMMTNYYNPNQIVYQNQYQPQQTFYNQNTQIKQENSDKYKDVSQDEDPNIKDEELCIICLANKKAGAFYKCGHNCCCNSCGKSFIGKNCPVCREVVYDYIKIFGA